MKRFVPCSVATLLMLITAISTTAWSQSGNNETHGETQQGNGLDTKRDAERACAQELYAISLVALVSQIRDGALTASQRRETASAELRPGQTGYIYTGIGRFNQDGSPDANDNSTGIGNSAKASDRQQLSNQFPHLWWIQVKLLSAKGNGEPIRARVNWQRWEGHRCGQSKQVDGDIRVLSIEEGQQHVFDFIDFPSARDTFSTRSLAFAIEATVQEDKRYENEPLGVELWMQHRDGRGELTTRSMNTTVRHGEQASFQFQPMRFGIGAFAEDGREAESILSFKGTLRARLRDDGQIDLLVRSTREAGGALQGSLKGGGAGLSTERRVVVRPGETIGLRFPAEKKSSFWFQAGGRAFEIDHSVFYEGHEDTLIVKLTR